MFVSERLATDQREPTLLVAVGCADGNNALAGWSAAGFERSKQAMDGDQFDELLELARKLGIGVRHVRLGGSGGGLAKFKNQRQLFIDQDATATDQLEQTARAMAGVDELQNVYVRPDVRKLLDDWGGLRTTQPR